MPFDILVIIDEVKKFYRSEKGTILSLVVLLFIETVLFNYLFTNFSLHIPPTVKFPYFRTYGALLVITTILWLFDRHIYINPKKTNIGVSQFDLIDINLKSTLAGEARFTIREELNQYICSRLTHDNRSINFEKYIKVILLPARFAVDRYHQYVQRKYRFLDFLIYGVIYNELNSLTIHPHIVFVQNLSLPLFDQIKEHIAKKSKFEFYTDGRENLPFNKLLHEVTYIGILYTAIKYAHKRMYREANELIETTLDQLERLYKSDDQSVNFGDQDFLKIQELFYFVQAKNLHKFGNFLLFTKDNFSEAKIQYENASIELLKRAAILKRINQQEEVIDIHDFDHTYIYAIGLLAKEKNDEEGSNLLKKLKNKIIDESDLHLAEALFAERLEHPQKALKIYHAIIDQEENKFALRRMISIYYKNGNMTKTYDLIKRLQKITYKQVYDEQSFDLRVCIRFLVSAFFTLHFIDVIEMLIIFPFFIYSNKVESFKQTSI